MRLAKLITPKNTNALGVFRFSVGVVLVLAASPVFSQDNSPYSRYGFGDAVPSTNVTTRGMGSIAAGYSDPLSINFNNPASYGSFQALKEQLSHKLSRGRAVLDIGINYENRTLREPSSIQKFTASNLLFSHVQLGVPLRRNWGLSFGLRPVNRISYKIQNAELLKDPQTNQVIDSATTLYEGDGGAYMATLGTGVKIDMGKNTSLSLGVNGGYLFGKKDYSSRRAIYSTQVSYNSGNLQTKTTYGNLYANAGLQFQHWFNKNLYVSLGAYGNWKQTLNARQDILRETYLYDPNTGYVRQDSVYDQKDIKGEIIYPSSLTYGFVIEKINEPKKAGWLIGADLSQSKWDQYRFYGQADPFVKNSWQMRVGAQLRPVPKESYFTNMSYRAGVSFGPDYIDVGNKLSVLNMSLGFGLPLANYNRLSDQATIINVALEYIKRGNNNNLLKENMFRLSIGLSLSDIWFVKKKYN